MEFYITKNNQQLGPYTQEQLVVFVKQGLVTSDHLVWANEWPTWIPIRNVPGLVTLQLSSKNGDAQNGIKSRPSFDASPEESCNDIRQGTSDQYEVVGPRIGTVYMGSYQSGFRSTILPQVCSVYKTSVGWLALEYSKEGIWSSSRRVFVPKREARQINVLSASDIRRKVIRYKANAYCGGSSSASVVAYIVIYVWSVVIYFWGLTNNEDKRGLCVVFNDDKNALERVEIIGDSPIITDLLAQSQRLPTKEAAFIQH